MSYSNHIASTVEWYVNWLTENRPDLTVDQRLELATGFTQAQQPPVQKPDEEEELAIETEIREEQRRHARLSGKQLRAIIGDVL